MGRNKGAENRDHSMGIQLIYGKGDNLLLIPLPYAYSLTVEFEYTTSAVLALTVIFLSVF